jgi:hypothetical protein
MVGQGRQLSPTGSGGYRGRSQSPTARISPSRHDRMVGSPRLASPGRRHRELSPRRVAVAAGDERLDSLYDEDRILDDTYGFRRYPMQPHHAHGMYGVALGEGEDEFDVAEERRQRQVELRAQSEELRALEIANRVEEHEEEVRLALQRERLERQAQLDAEAALAAERAEQAHEVAEAEYDAALEEQERALLEQQHREAQREIERERRLRANMYGVGAAGRAAAWAAGTPLPVANSVRRGAPLRPARVVHTRVADMDPYT